MFDRVQIMRLFCVGLVAAIMLPFGSLLYPYVSHELSGIEFQALEAVASAGLGFGIFTLLG